ncbi:MAG: winged helix-turn-helix transcriptional regulator [Candidatus Bathyarchaeota archaeon]|nr:MAG: winged helix-turn-helix transcriptional regulator [Candidatus Bathyarchaeota archaeon]
MSQKDSKTIGKSIEETRQYHIQYLRAINYSIRRKILRSIRNGNVCIKNLQASTGLDPDILNWHLNLLEYGFCIEKEIKKGKIVYRITQEGEIVDYLK